jgi:hypothetical protein
MLVIRILCRPWVEASRGIRKSVCRSTADANSAACGRNQNLRPAKPVRGMQQQFEPQTSQIKAQINES